MDTATREQHKRQIRSHMAGSHDHQYEHECKMCRLRASAQAASRAMAARNRPARRGR